MNKTCEEKSQSLPEILVKMSLLVGRLVPPDIGDGIIALTDRHNRGCPYHVNNDYRVIFNINADQILPFVELLIKNEK